MSDHWAATLQENYLNHQPSMAHSEATAMQVIAKAADAFSAGDIANRRIRTFQEWHLAPHSAVLSAVYPAAYMRCDLSHNLGARCVMQIKQGSMSHAGSWGLACAALEVVLCLCLSCVVVPACIQFCLRSHLLSRHSL